jgi:hypothetical protein
MSETTKPLEQREMTQEDFQALMAAEIWLDKLNSAGETLQYQKMWIAVYDRQVIAAHADKNELYRQLDALGDSINQFRVLVRYIRSLEEVALEP